MERPLISGIRWVEELISIAGGDPIFPNFAHVAKRKTASSIHPQLSRAIRSHPRFVVRNEGQHRRYPRATRLGFHKCSAERPHLRDPVNLHFAARPRLTHEGVRQLHAVIARIVGAESPNSGRPNSLHMPPVRF